VSFTIIIFILEVMTSISPPGFYTCQLRNFIVKETASKTATELFKTEPLKNVWLLTISCKLLRSPFRMHIVHCVIPSSARVLINFPAVLFIWGCPIWYFETFKQCTRLSVETNITYTFKKCCWMEVLSINMEHDVRLLVEFIVVDILNTQSYNN